MAHLVLVQGLTEVLNLVKDPAAGGRAGFVMPGYAAAATAVVALGAAPAEKTMYLGIIFNHRNSHDTVGPLLKCEKERIHNTFKQEPIDM